MAYKLQVRRDTSDRWLSFNPILADGEIGYEKDTGFLKLGDGITAWDMLEYVEGDTRAALIDHVLDKANPHEVTKAQVGLGKADNTSDLNKPISNAAQAEFEKKVDKVEGKGLSDQNYTLAEKQKLAGVEEGAEANTVESVANKTGAVTLDKSDVGLGNVDNTADLDKPISTAAQGALDGKADKATTLSGYGIGDAYTKNEVDNIVSSVYKFRGNVATFGDLPSTGQVVGDVYNVLDSGINYAWDGTGWDDIGGVEALATAANNGLMSKEDYSKLLGIEANAKDDQAASEVPITDTGDYFTSGDVEGALQEAGGRLVDVETAIKHFKIESWSDLQQLVREGVHEKVIEVGDQLIAEYDGVEYLIDVIGINHDIPSDPQYTNSLTLQFHDCIMNCQFDAPEWLFYADAELVAGTYYFYDSYNSANYEFTTAQSVPLGGSIDVSGWGDSQNPTEVKTYDASGVLLETLPVTVSATGTELTTCNDLRRVRYGSNNYLESNIREFLNSEEDTFQFDKQTVYDRASASSPYSGAGFLKNLDPELRAVIGPVNKQVIRNTVTDGGGQDLFSDTVFLLSRKEVYGGDEGDVTGEAPYAYYQALAASPTTGDLDGRIKYLSGSARYWWLRSPDPAYSYYPRLVYTTGSIYYGYGAYYALGLAPACTIY